MSRVPAISVPVGPKRRVYPEAQFSRETIVLPRHVQKTGASYRVRFVISPSSKLRCQLPVMCKALNLGRGAAGLSHYPPTCMKVRVDGALALYLESTGGRGVGSR